VVFRDSNHLTQIGKVVIEVVYMPALSVGLAVSAMVTSPYGKIPLGEVVCHVSVSATVLAYPVSYHKYGLRLSRWHPRLVENSRATRALKTALHVLQTCVRQSRSTMTEWRSNV
jgi:hypothetical protein